MKKVYVAPLIDRVEITVSEHILESSKIPINPGGGGSGFDTRAYYYDWNDEDLSDDE